MNIFSPFFLMLLTTAPLSAQPADYERLAITQAAANSKPGLRHLPERAIPVPTEGVSPEEQVLIGAPYPPFFNDHPKNQKEWKKWVLEAAADSIAALPALKKRFAVTVTPAVIGGVNAFIIAPKTLPERNKNRLLVHLHGGGYLFGPGEAGIREAVPMASFGGFKIISVADLNVYEGQSHAQFNGDLDAPETEEAITDIARFFDNYLGK